MWKPLGGTTRRYTNTQTGETISRRQYDQLHNPNTFDGGKIPQESRRHMNRYNRIVTDYIAQKYKDDRVKDTHAKMMTRRAARTSPELKQIVKALKSKDNSKDGIKAIALLLLGRRNGDEDYPVGGSPQAT